MISGLLHQVGHKVDGVEGLSSPSSAGGVQFDLSNEDHRVRGLKFGLNIVDEERGAQGLL